MSSNSIGSNHNTVDLTVQGILLDKLKSVIIGFNDFAWFVVLPAAPRVDINRNRLST